MSELNINRKEHHIGSVVYFIKQRGYDKEVSFGIVEEHYPDVICLQLYELIDTRLINGIPIKDFITPTRWCKLPRGWSYDTKLFDITYGEYPCDPRNYRFSSPDDILKAVEDGVLVKIQDNDHAHISSEIDGKQGWRIRREYPAYEYHQRQSELSEYDWLVEQIDKELSRWAYMCSISEEDKQKYRDWILSLERVEDIEIRIFENNIQWKYWKNKKWMNIVL